MSKAGKLLLVCVGGLLGLIALGSLLGSPGGSENQRLDLEVTSWQLYVGQDGAYIEGTVRNNSRQRYSYVQVNFTLYDRSGHQIGNAFTNLLDLEPGREWRFRADVIGVDPREIAYARLGHVTGW